jgi:peptide/nickel transport system substrate-binding protein
VEWLGLPGYVPARLDSLFFSPLPKHAWSKYKPAELLTAEEVSRRPLGWGPYVVEEWKAGQSIRLRKNPNYFRAAEGLPKFDVLNFRFFSEQGDANLEAVLQGRCDVVDQTALLDDQLRTLINYANDKKISLLLGQGPEWEHLDFGIRPASYDDGFTAGKDRPDFFGDVRVRKAFTYCIDRDALVKKYFFSRTTVPGGYLPPGHPLYQPVLAALPYDPAAGAKLLDEAGWKDADNNPETPRLSQGLPGAAQGAPFTIVYTVTENTQRRNIAIDIQKNLIQCGISLTIRQLPLGEMFGPGPDGPVFGRSFDLAQFAWDAGSQPQCVLYESSQVPTAKNNWIGANVTGLAGSSLDAACQKARQARPGTAGFASAAQEAERQFAAELPVIPLYYRLKIAVGRPDLCGLALDPSARSLLAALESLDYGTPCKP